MGWNEEIRTFTSYGDLLPRRRVKIKSGTTTTPPQVEYAGLGETYIGITQAISLAATWGGDGTPVPVELVNADGTFVCECTVSSSIVRGTVLYGAASGCISDASSGSAVGVAMEAGVTGQLLEFVPFNVMSTTAATVSIVDSGGFTAQTTAEAALAEIYQHIETAQASIPIPLGAITLEDGTALTKQATTVTGYAQLANKEIVIEIPIDCTSGEALGFSVALPQDIDIAKDLSVHVLVGKGGALDALTLDCEVYPDAVGDLANADIQDTAATAIVATGTELTFVCGADGLLASPSAITAVLTLGGTNDGDATYIYAVWVEYARKILTA